MSIEALRQVAYATHLPDGRAITGLERDVLVILADFDPIRPSASAVAKHRDLTLRGAVKIIDRIKAAGAISIAHPDAGGYTFSFQRAKHLPALTRLVKAARAWHEFHAHEPRLVQCDAICEALPAAEAELAAVQA